MTAAAVEQALSLPVLEILTDHLDEDWAVPCEVGVKLKRSNGEVCDRAAEWIAWSVTCCPDRYGSILLCETHRASIAVRVMVCAFCREPFLPGITGFRLIEPLNRRTT